MNNIEKLQTLPLTGNLTADIKAILTESRSVTVRAINTTTDEKGYTLCIQLPWSHNRLIMRVQDSKAREWYLREAAREGWSVRQLERNINSFYYQRQLESASRIVEIED